ncbi:unnamed protein product [Mytilus coruscus]|uniref:Uncharacterized protein n=1 Tax=Mytilus coruscus TaxID=42192 RepID=A0A6J8EC58_MYTCO|nr:unnamed protein product [Mytilus coruscus]
MVREKSRIWCNAPKHGANSNDEQTFVKDLHEVKAPTPKLHQISSPVFSTKHTCAPQNGPTPKRIRLLTPKKYSPASIFTNDNNAIRRPEEDDTSFLNDFKIAIKNLEEHNLATDFLSSENGNQLLVSFFYTFFLHVLVVCLVYWVLKTPVVFGDSATLTCMVEQKDNCDSEATRRWDGGLNKNILLLNGHSTNASKYYEVVDQPCDNFSMVIMDFGMNDVNCEYRCTFEFETSRRMLTLDARHFIGMVCFCFLA